MVLATYICVLHIIDCQCFIHIYRFRKTKSNIICIPMHKCMISENSTMSLSVDTVAVNYSPSSQSSPNASNYSALQFNYNADPLNNNVPMNPGAMPLYNHLNCNTVSFISSSSFLEMHSNHSTASSNNDTTSNIMLQANGYVLPNDSKRESHTHTIGCNCSAGTQLKSEDKATHKTAVILKSDGTGIIRTGTLQALIPPSRSDENYTVTPSQTH